MNRRNNERDILDIINALGLYKASESGALEERLDPTRAGITGSLLTDTQKALSRFSQNEITEEEAVTDIKMAAKISLTSIVTYAVNKGIDVVADVVKTYMPTIAPIVEVGKFIVKSVIVKPIVNLVSAGWNWLTRKIFG